MSTTISGDGFVTLDGSASTQGRIRLAEQTGNGTNVVTVQAPASLAADLTLTLPSADGTNGQFLQTNGSGQLAFATVPTTAPAGSTGQVQYNNAGAFGAISSGTSGQVLQSAGAGVAPTWANPAMVPISSSSISAGSSEIIIPNLDFTTYKMYVVELIALACSSNNVVRVRMSTNNGSSFSSTDYAYSFMVLGTAYSQSGTGASTSDSFYLCSNPGVASNYTVDHTIRLYAPNGQYASISSASRLANASVEQVQFSSGTNIAITSYNAIRIFPSAGTFSSGFVRVYGVY